MSALDIAAVIRDHATIATGLGEYCCKCSPTEWRSIAHRSAHVADALRPVIAAAQAEAYREIADRLDTWEFPAGSDVLDPMYRLVGSLRDRADRIGGGL